MTKVFFKWVVILIAVYISISNGRESFAQIPIAGSLYQCWEYQNEQEGSFKIASDNVNLIFFADNTGHLSAFDIADGKLVWRTDLGGSLISEIRYDKENVYLVTETGNEENLKDVSATHEVFLRSISLQTGLPIWQQKFIMANSNGSGELRNTQISLLIYEKSIYMIDYAGNISILDAAAGTINKQLNLGLGLSSIPVISGKHIYFATTGKTLNSLSLEDNQNSRLLDLKNSVKILYAGKDGEIFLGDSFGMVYAFDLKDKKILWKSRTGAEIIDINKEMNALYISSNDNFLYSMSDSSGNLNWKKRLAGRNEFVLMEGSSLLFSATLNTDTFTISDVSKGKTVNQVFLHEDSYFIGKPILVKDYVAVPTNAGFTVYSLKDCRQKEISKPN